MNYKCSPEKYATAAGIPLILIGFPFRLNIDQREAAPLHTFQISLFPLCGLIRDPIKYK